MLAAAGSGLEPGLELAAAVAAAAAAAAVVVVAAAAAAVEFEPVALE